MEGGYVASSAPFPAKAEEVSVESSLVVIGVCAGLLTQHRLVTICIGLSPKRPSRRLSRRSSG